MSKEGKDYKDDAIMSDDEPLAFVSLSGLILECNEKFAALAGAKTQKSLANSNLTDLAKFSDPTIMLEAAYLLDQLGSNTAPGDHWQADLKPHTSHDDEYILYVTRSSHKIHGHKILSAAIKPASHLAPSKLLRSSFRNGGSFKGESFENVPLAVCEISPNKSQQRVLIVEDSPTSLKLMERMITNLGHKVSTAVNGIDALDMLRSETFDIVLMDINMPMMNGLEASHEFRKLERANRAGGKTYQKIIAMSGDISNTLFQEVSNAGFDAFIPKPLTKERFLEVLNLPVNNAFK